MIFVDYFFEIGPNGNMALDRDLSLKELGWHVGDQFEVELINNRIFLKRIKAAEGTTEEQSTFPVPVY